MELREAGYVGGGPVPVPVPVPVLVVSLLEGLGADNPLSKLISASGRISSSTVVVSSGMRVVERAI
jgi:hypothetical protein